MNKRGKSQINLSFFEPMEQREPSSLLVWPSDRGRQSQREYIRDEVSERIFGEARDTKESKTLKKKAWKKFLFAVKFLPLQPNDG